MILATRGGLPMATTALDETLQRDRTAELSALPTPLTRGGKSEASRRSDIFERSPAAGAGRAALPTVEYARVSDELERRSREWTAMVRLLEQNRHTLDCAEMERDAAYDELARIVRSCRRRRRTSPRRWMRAAAGGRRRTCRSCSRRIASL